MTFDGKYFEVLDVAARAIKERCEQQGLTIYIAIEQLLINATRGVAITEHQLDEICKYFGIFIFINQC